MVDISLKTKTSTIDDNNHLRLINAVRMGFAAVLTLAFLLGMVGLHQLRTVNAVMTSIVEVNNQKISLAFSMRDAIRLRALSAQKMLATDDYFEREEELHNFYGYAGVYRGSRDLMFKLDMSAQEKLIHDKLLALATDAQPKNRLAAESLLSDPVPDNLNNILSDATQAQQRLLNLLDEFINLQQENARESVVHAQEKFRLTIVIMLAAVAILMSLGAFIARLVTRFVAQQNGYLAQKNRELEEANRVAHDATQAKTDFLANMSHEIRTPLTSIIGFSETLLDTNQSPDDLHHAALTIHSSGNHLHQIINDVLDISKIEAGQMELELLNVSPTELVTDVVAMVAERANHKGLEVHTQFIYPLPKQIETDSTRFRQILLNLLGNAIKFTNEGYVSLAMQYDQEARQLRIEIADTGIGMSPEHMDKVFEPFAQADTSTSRRFGGTGLGLSISKHLAQRLGGAIVCTSYQGAGSVFTLTISIGSIEQVELIERMEKSTQGIVRRAIEQKERRFSGHVLLAEDVQENQMLISMYMRKAGVTCNVVENGQQAVEHGLHHEYDLILMDMQMPVMDGLSAIKKLRESGYDKPIVALTANALREDRDRCLQSGADNYMCKPIDVDKFYEILGEYLKPVSGPSAQDAASAEENAHVLSQPHIHSSIQQNMALLDEDEEYLQIVQAFVDNLPELIGTISLSASERNWQELQRCTHKLKGLGGSFGYDQLTEISESIMECAQNESYIMLDDLLGQLKSEHERIRLENQQRKAS